MPINELSAQFRLYIHPFPGYIFKIDVTIHLL
nr:MAG TPA: hypothetical protein [Bacteriophage sp.]